MKKSNFYGAMIAFILMMLGFCVGMNGQTDTCNLPNCGGWNQPDFKKLNNTLIQIRNKTGGGGGGGSSLRQSTLDSINKASYYSGIGSSQANLISENNAVMTSVLDAINNSLDSLNSLIKNTQAVGHGITDYFRSDVSTNAYSIMPFINQYTQATSANTGEIDGAVYDYLIHSVFKNLAGQSYLENTSPVDTLLTETSYATLVADLNTFYSNPYHANSRILQESHTNAIVGATLTYYCVIRFKQ